MRTIRALTASLALVAALPGASEAQIIRPFENSWFWGGKAGTLVYSTYSTSRAMAPMAGADWLITRKRGGLYVSYAHAFFDRTEFVQLDTMARTVDIANLRRVDVALMVFPGMVRLFKVYGGLGLSLNQVAYAQPQGTFGDPDADPVVREFRTAIAPLFMAGAQLQGPLIAIFGQASAVATRGNHFLHGSTPFNVALEGGVRINIGSAIDRH